MTEEESFVVILVSSLVGVLAAILILIRYYAQPPRSFEVGDEVYFSVNGKIYQGVIIEVNLGRYWVQSPELLHYDGRPAPVGITEDHLQVHNPKTPKP